MENKDKNQMKIDRYGNIGFLLGICLIALINLVKKQPLFDIFTIFFLYLGLKYLAQYKIEKTKAQLFYSLASLALALGNLVSYLGSI